MSVVAIALRPAWLRPTALALIVAAHSTAFLVFNPDVIPAPPLDSLEVGLVPLGESDAEQKPQEEIAAAEPPPDATPTAAAPPELTAPPPQVIAPDAPPLPVAKPKPKPVVKEEAERRKRELAEKRRQEKEEAREEAREAAREKERRKAQEARAEARRGAVQGAQHASGMAPRAYAGLVVAELNRRKFFPAAARAEGVTGSVGVAFTIGPSGRVVSQSITRSSGSGALDGAARAIMSSLHTPPPPGGRFSTATSIRFNLR